MYELIKTFSFALLGKLEKIIYQLPRTLSYGSWISEIILDKEVNP